MKPWTKILMAFVGLVVVAVVSIPLFVNANTFRPAIEKQLTTALGRSVKLGDLSLSLFSGSLVAKDLSVADDPGFSAAPFLTAKELRIGVSLRLLIFSRQVNLRSFQIESPQITVIRAANGTWNFSSIGRLAASANAASGISKGSAPELPDLSVGRIVIEDGRAVIASVPAHDQPSVYEHVNLTARDFSFASQFPFELNANSARRRHHQCHRPRWPDQSRRRGNQPCRRANLHEAPRPGRRRISRSKCRPIAPRGHRHARCVRRANTHHQRHRSHPESQTSQRRRRRAEAA